MLKTLSCKRPQVMLTAFLKCVRNTKMYVETLYCS